MKKVFILILLLITVISLAGCNNVQSNFEKCVNEDCDLDKSKEVATSYFEELALEKGTDIYFENFSFEAFIFTRADSDSARIDLIYNNDNLNYMDIFDILDHLYDVLLFSQEELSKMNFTKDIILSVTANIDEGHNSYTFSFKKDGSDNIDYLFASLDGFKDDHDLFMDNIYDEINSLFDYSEDFIVKLELVTDIGYIHLDTTASSGILELEVNSDPEVEEALLNELKTSFEEALDNQFEINIVD